MSTDGAWGPEIFFELVDVNPLKCTLEYIGDTKDWLSDFYCYYQNGVYVVGANCLTKRADMMIGSFSGPTGFGLVAHIAIPQEDPVESCVWSFFVDPTKYRLWDFEFRYGPTFLIVPYPEYKTSRQIDLEFVEALK